MLVLAVVMPVVLALLFGTAMSTNLENVPLVVEDNDNTRLSRDYVETYAAAAGQFVLVPGPSGRPIFQALLNGTARAALVLPVHFERDYKRGLAVQVQVLIDGTDANAATGLKNVAKSLNQAFLDRHPVGSQTLLVRICTRLWYNPGRSSRRFFGSGTLGLVLILFPSLLGALTVAREHELGTLIQVYASTLSASQWLIGKALPCIAVGLVELGLCFALGLFVFEYRLPSDPTPLLVASVLYVTAGVFFGVMVGNMTESQSAAIQAVQLGAFLISMLLSGFLVPVSNIPPELRWVAMLLPARHYIDVVRDALLRDGGWATAAFSIVALAVLTMFFFNMSFRRMRRMQFSG